MQLPISQTAMFSLQLTVLEVEVHQSSPEGAQPPNHLRQLARIASLYFFLTIS